MSEFYRNKDHAYFSSIKDGIMEKCLKVNDSDPHCPINRKLKGLFFMCISDDISRSQSPFGPKRLILPAGHIFKAGTNLYFSNFFCIGSSKTHYISLVITKPLSEADTFCQQNLIELDKYNNPFLKLVDKGKDVNIANVVHMTERNRRLLVEIFYTEDIDISDVPLEVGVRNSGPRFVVCSSTNPNGKFTRFRFRYGGCNNCIPQTD